MLNDAVAVELIDHQSWATRAQVRRTVFEFIEASYNGKLHPSLNFLRPVEFEATRVSQHKAAPAA